MQSRDDVRVQELQDFAASEGIMLPMPIRLILWFEDRGCVVDLHTGIAHRPTVGTPTASGRAVSHLLADHVGELVYER
jgi:hypothetical protein